MFVPIKISYCRDAGQLIWLAGHFEKAAFSGQIDRFIWRYRFIASDVLFKTTNTGAPKKTEVIQTGAPAEFAAGRTF